MSPDFNVRRNLLASMEKMIWNAIETAALLRKMPQQGLLPAGQRDEADRRKMEKSRFCALSIRTGRQGYNGLKLARSGALRTRCWQVYAQRARGRRPDMPQQYMEMPGKVEYALTDRCAELMPILAQLAQWVVRVHTRNRKARPPASIKRRPRRPSPGRRLLVLSKKTRAPGAERGPAALLPKGVAE
jgi:hypothetical protein